MSSILDRCISAVARRPRVTLAAILVLTLVLASGTALLQDQAGDEVFLPSDSEISRASDVMVDAFPDSAGLSAVTIVFRGDVVTPEGLSQIDQAVTAAAADPAVAERLALTSPVVSPAALLETVLGVDDLATVSQSTIDAAVEQLTADPEAAAAWETLVGTADGDGLAIASVKLRELGEPDALADAERAIEDVAPEVDGPLAASVLSAATIEDEKSESSSESMGMLVFLALGVIAALLFVFFRTGSDVLLALIGLGATIVGTMGAQGWLGPDGLGVIDAPNTITTMVPIILIGLCVDYGIQGIAHYREERGHGRGVSAAMGRGLRGVALPLGLAAGTTVVSFLTNLTSPIPANRDFGVVAAFGVAFGLVVMLTLVPSCRAIADARRERRGRLTAPRPIADAIPGAGAAARGVGRAVARAPMRFLLVIGVVAVVLGFASTNLSTEFDSTDFLPGDGQSLSDIDALEEGLDGRSEVVNVLVEADLTDDRTLRNLYGITEAFSDDLSRPTGAKGDITLSLGTLYRDWITDDGPGDERYDPELAELAAATGAGGIPDPDDVQAILDRLELVDPDGFALVAVDNPDGSDRTLIQFDAVSGDQDRTAQMVEDLEGLWYGDTTEITATSGEITSLEVVGSMTDSQTTAIATTIIAALAILVLFFGLTTFRPILGVIAVAPILLVLICVLGTMALIGIPYNVVTALITALSIGIGVDYTIHVIHRFQEELEHLRGDVTAAVTRTLSGTGSALLGSALTTALGFAVLLFSPLTPFRQFGLVTAITITYALLAAVIVVPPLLVVWAAYHRWREAAGLPDEPGPLGPTLVVEPATAADADADLVGAGVDRR